MDTQLVDAADALISLIRTSDPAGQGDFLAYAAPEIRQLQEAVDETRHCIEAVGRISAEL